MSDPGTSGRSEKELFFEALEKNSPTERSAFLDGACGKEPVLRARVEALLADHFQQDAFMKEPALEEDRPNLELDLGPEAAPAQMLGRYKLLEKIGEGGFGEVWMAEQREPVKRRVALKIIKLGMDSRQIVARFEAERQALAMMDHPNIAKIFDAGTTENPHPASGHPLPSDGRGAGGEGVLQSQIANRKSEISQGRPYFVMELVRGIKITEYCDQNELPTRERLRLFILVCQAIQHAHQKGIIHRDIKPSNILVTLHDGVPVPKVIDFGIAKATQQELTDKTVFTQFQQFIGTPAYISPEQAEMSGLDIDTRADIYSLGVLLYELLVGQTPFDAKEMMRGGLDALRRIIREKEPLRPSTKLNTLPGEARTTAGKRRQTDVGKLVNQLQGDLDWIVMKCLEKDRTRRYETANGLAMDIQRHLAHEPVVARPPSAAYKLQKAWQRNRLVFGAGMAVAVVLLVGITASLWQAARATQAKIQADASSQSARESEQKARRAEAGQTLLREQAEVHELAARRRAYASDMSLAQQSLVTHNLGRATELLNRQRPTKESESDLRGWEWRYLWEQCRSDAAFTLCQRSNSIFSLSASHDGKWLAIGEVAKGGISIWDLTTRRQVADLSVGYLAAFSPRESLLAFCGAGDRESTNRGTSVRLWDATTRRIIAELPLEGGYRGLAFSQDGRTLVVSSGGWNGGPSELSLWQIPEGKKLAAYPAPQDDNGIGIPFALAPDLSVAAHGVRGGGIRVVDLANGRERWTAQATDVGWIESLALSPNGKILASSSGIIETSIRLWDVDSGKEIGRLEGHRAYVIGLTFWSDGKTLASTSADQTIRLWDLADVNDLRPLSTLRGHRLEVWRLAMLADNKTLVSGCKDGSVYVWDTKADRRARSNFVLPTHGSRMLSWKFTADSQAILTCHEDGLVARWHGDDFQEMQPVFQLGSNVREAHISEDGRMLAAGSTNGPIKVCDLERRVIVGEFGAPNHPNLPCAFLAQGRRLLAFSPRELSVSEWDLPTGQKKQSWPSVDKPRGTLSPDERWWLTFERDGSVLIRNLVTGHEMRADMQVRQAFGGTFSPDGKLVAVASSLGFARLFEFDNNTLRESATLRGFLLGVNSVAFSSDGNRLATTSAGKEAIKLWDVASHQELLTLDAQVGTLWGAGFSPDGRVLGATTEGGVLHLWRAPSWEEISAAEAKEIAGMKQP